MMVGGPERRSSAWRRSSTCSRRRATRAGASAPRLGALRPERRRPLREDGPQRRRVRPHAGLRRGLRPLRQVATSTSTTRRSPTSGTRARSCARGCASWPRWRSSRRATTSATCRATPRTPARGAGRSRTRWTRTSRPPSSRRRCTRASTRAATATSRTAVLRRAARAVRRPRDEEERRRVSATDRAHRGRAQTGAGDNPLTEGLERLPVHPTDARDLRRDGRPRAAQAAAGALQPRPRGRAARALRARRRRAVGDDRRGVPRAGERVRARVLAPLARREGARQAASPTCATWRARSTTAAVYEGLHRELDEFDAEAGCR